MMHILIHLLIEYIKFACIVQSIYTLGMLWGAYVLREAPAPFAPSDMTWEDKLFARSLWPLMLWEKI